MARRRTIAQEESEVDEPGLIRAILVDPTDCIVRLVDMPTMPGVAGRHGTQLAPDALVAVLGKRVEQVDLFDGAVMLVAVPGTDDGWRLGLDGPYEGPGVLVSYDKQTDSYSDTRLTLERVADLVVFEDDDADRNEAEEERDAQVA